MVVGHTPADEARAGLCGGQLVATDSALSRHFRAYGNRYCPVPDQADSGWVGGEGGGGGAGVGGGAGEGSYVVSPDESLLSEPSFEASGCAAPLVGLCEGSVVRLSRPSPRDSWPEVAERVSMPSPPGAGRQQQEEAPPACSPGPRGADPGSDDSSEERAAAAAQVPRPRPAKAFTPGQVAGGLAVGIGVFWSVRRFAGA